MMNSAFRLLCACTCAFALGACSPSFPLACTPNILFGVNVTVVDSLTDAPPSSARLIARSAAYVDSVEAQAPTPLVTGVLLTLGAAPERAGTYDVTVRSPGYREWTRTGVQVTAEECHVHPVALTARLQK